MADAISIPNLPHKEALKILSYDPETGVLRWKVARGRQPAGALAGTPKDGYLSVRVHGVIVRAHRLIWFLVTGEWPSSNMTIDHVNRDRSDNRWINLRLATIGENTANQSLRTDNTTGERGIYAHKNGRFYAHINHLKKRISLGGFDSFDDAVAVRRAAERQYFGDFAAV